MRILIVDDEPLAREGLRLLLATADDMQIVGECSNGIEALAALQLGNIDLVLLDIHMPGLSGLEVVASLGADRMPLVIFLTAYDQHAIDAFRLNALDYLLKPVQDERFQQSLTRTRQQYQQRSQQMQHQQLTALLAQLHQQLQPKPLARLEIRSGGHVFFVNPTDISHLSAEGDYVWIIANGKKHLVRDTLKQMDERLTPHGFQRIHRSHIVNLSAIRELLSDNNGDYTVVLHDDNRLKLSRAYRDALWQKLQY